MVISRHPATRYTRLRGNASIEWCAYHSMYIRFCDDDDRPYLAPLLSALRNAVSFYGSGLRRYWMTPDRPWIGSLFTSFHSLLMHPNCTLQA